ncbi:protein draper isoform X4 [Culex quinquefasciatus]|uniref:protein draper isoform X4 n=1 Tax=Culex quinquefasciatus TaxID=7176 RepID=UPI0018E3AE10|nr:protein draper isoform X4 [Culex quinquefasciatus]
MRSIRLMNARAFGLVVILTTALAAAQLDELVVDDDLEGPNVCKEVEQYQVFVTAPREITYQERYQKWCVAVPPRCSAYRVRTKIVNETTGINKERILKKCCSGYAKNKELNRCEPVCNPGCRHGKCIAPETCRCDQGYVGKSCNIIISDKPLTLWEEFVKYKKQRDCPPNRWGSDCSQVCKCKNNSTCDAQDGSCSCPKGYRGTTCEFQCPSDRFGQDCAEMCQCLNGGKCDPVSGECYCAPGFTGPLCAQKCPEGKHGDQCQSDCRCQNGGSCDSQTGKCICPAGYTGSVCANRCQSQRYGKDCAEKCECFNGADCNHVTGECICAPGFMGAKCLDSCPSNTYGINCTEQCRCLNKAECDSATGKCSCLAGWTGADCGMRICPDDRYGDGCTKKCECDVGNTKMCHPWTGKCLCEPGWSSAACDRPCPFLKYGQDCSIHCNCKNNSPCNHINGTCNCIAGFKGEICEEQCDNGTYGQNCSERCECQNGATCAPETGQCFCAPGWQGIRCDRPCDTHRYGKDCAQSCNCTNGGVCNPVNGQCTCPAGWSGEKCEQKCESGRFGQNCSQSCDCHLENTLACNATTGKCICKADWGETLGVRCESRCQMGLYGESCSEVCACHNNSSCDPITGECICSRGWTGANCDEPCPDGFFGHGCKERCPGTMHGNTTCNHITGKYSCRPGYIGTTCEHPCPTNTYGPECSLKCTCKNGGECSHETGMCQCPPGWTGANCEAVCPNGFYGPNCSQKCSCKNDAKCRKNDGQCICNPGWMGNRCDEVCPEGFYGNHCMDSCNCPAGNFVCHAALGCLCSNGYTGEKCDVSAAEAKIHRKDEASNAGLAWGLVLAVMFVGVIIALVLYYRRRVANLKAEVNHVVNYMCQEQPGHFDNPVYSAYQGQPGSGSGAAAAGNRLENNGLLPNGSLIRNNLRTQKSNLDKYRYPENESVGTDRSYSIQYLTESQKNFDADMTNPNYNTIDDKDHVYDEIKHKDGYKDLDTEYDHLDYSRPGSSHKTHYFRMPNPMSGGSPKEINVLRENGTTINNLSSPGLNIRQPLVVPVINAADCGSSSTNSSPTPPMLRANDSSNLYVKMTSEGRPRREVIRSAPAAAAVAIRFPSTSSISSRNVSRFCVCLVFEKSCECVRTQLGISDPLVNKQSPGEKLA